MAMNPKKILVCGLSGSGKSTIINLICRLYDITDPSSKIEMNDANISTYNVEYCDPNNQLSNLSVSYVLSTGSTLSNYLYPADVEYYQVITGLTVAQASTMWDTTTGGLLPNVMNSGTVVIYNEKTSGGTVTTYNSPEYKISDLFESFSEKYINIQCRYLLYICYDSILIIQSSKLMNKSRKA